MDSGLASASLRRPGMTRLSRRLRPMPLDDTPVSSASWRKENQMNLSFPHRRLLMRAKSLLILTTAASLCAVMSAHGQVVQPTPGVPGDYVLPDGGAKKLVQDNCTVCHNLRNIVNSNKSAEDWDNTVNMMMSAGAPITREQGNEIRDYLIASFPEKPRPKPAAIKGGPHGLINDRDGNIWYAGNWGGHVGKLDVKTGEYKFYPMPDPKARDPHTPLFDKDGFLWFSVQNGGFMGRLDPRTGDIKLFTPNGPSGQQPYALRFLSDGRQPWFSYWGSNKIATIDPDKLELKEYVLPDARTRIRRMGVTSDDMIWFGNWGTGKLGRLDPKTGAVTEWDGPSGPQSQPYGMTVIDDKIWYVESNTRPNNLVRFDPKTEKFQTWQIPNGGGIVRHMMPTRDGNIAMAMSGLNMVGIVEILPSSSN